MDSGPAGSTVGCCRFHFASNMRIACQVLRQELPVGEALRKSHGPQYAGVRKLRALCVSVIFAEHTFVKIHGNTHVRSEVKSTVYIRAGAGSRCSRDSGISTLVNPLVWRRHKPGQLENTETRGNGNGNRKTKKNKRQVTRARLCQSEFEAVTAYSHLFILWQTICFKSALKNEGCAVRLSARVQK